MEELALSYCVKQKNIDNIVFGVDSHISVKWLI